MAEKLQAMEEPEDTTGWEEHKKPRATTQAIEDKHETADLEEAKQEPHQND